MQVLTVDIGTGTQDIFLYDSHKSIENGYQLVMPSPTLRLANRVHEATRQGYPLLLEGVLMGGGPVGWAVRDHLLAGNKVFCLPDPARTFDDDPVRVAEMGIEVISEDEAVRLLKSFPDLQRLRLGDFDFEPIAAAFAGFGLDLQPDALAVAVFDHGAAPPELSDRTFRFDFIASTLRTTNHLASFAYPVSKIPARLTRFQAVAQIVHTQLPQCDPVLLMDTGPAAALGATDDPHVAEALGTKGQSSLVVNLGNFHTLAFLFEDGLIKGTFEHHTGEITAPQLLDFLAKLSTGDLTNEEIFNSQGHGAVLLERISTRPGLLSVTGPRRALLKTQQLTFPAHPPLKPYFAVPNGDMMLAGNYGLLQALDYHFPELGLNLEAAHGNLSLEW